mgnify:FL=1|tara:strand:- start:54 stop:392 length:339 start_codon:yes stop_codon:yes gene_type:complete
MLNKKLIISSVIFVSLLLITSTIKNKTRLIEKEILNLNTQILIKKKDINETQLDFYYLTSPLEIEKRLKIIGLENYQPIVHSKIFFDISDFTKIKNKITNLKRPNEKKIKKK